MANLKCCGYSVTATEVPNEISICYEISGCPHKCEGCHSPYLRKDIGIPLFEEIKSSVKMYSGLITCLCFMGGDGNKSDLRIIAKRCKDLYPNIKLAVYSGDNQIPDGYEKLFDYIKVGEYIENRGGLNCNTTNQKMYLVENGTFKDITKLFQKTRR